MNIRLTCLEELPLLMEMYEKARTFMQATGNAHQWINGYPSEEFILQEKKDVHSYVSVEQQYPLIIKKKNQHVATIFGIDRNIAHYGKKIGECRGFTGAKLFHFFIAQSRVDQEFFHCSVLRRVVPA